MTEEQAARRARLTLAMTDAEREAVRTVAAEMPELGGESLVLRRYSLEQVVQMAQQKEAA